MDSFSTINEMLVSQRTRSAITSAELASKAGIKEGTLQSLESGKFYKPEVVNSVLNALGYEMMFTPKKIERPRVTTHISDNLLPLFKQGYSDFDIALQTHRNQNSGTAIGHGYQEILQRRPSAEFFSNDSNELIKKDCLSVPFHPRTNTAFTFIDLFAGVGGFRLAMQSVGGKCVFSSEWDKAAQNTYYDNYGEYPFGDITKRETKDCIPHDFDVLCGGFPCQPFSLAGQKQGFLNETQGTLFFDILQIIREHHPRVVFLENVRNLVGHDKGKTFSIIQNAIRAEGYSFKHSLIDASPLVPQKRIRCYMVCVRDDIPFSFPKIEGAELPQSQALEDNVPESFTLSDRLWLGHQNRTKRNLDRGTGFTAFTADLSKPAHTLVARYYKDGKECLVPQDGQNPRMLTPRECARLQGFPEDFILPESKTVAYKQMGNSVAVPVLKKIAESIIQQITFD